MRKPRVAMIKKLLRFLSIVILAWTIAAFGLSIFLNTENGKKWLINVLLHPIEAKTQAKWEIDQIQFDLPFCLDFKQIKIYTQDQSLPVSQIGELKVQCHLLPLITSHTLNLEIKAKDVHIQNLAIPTKPLNQTVSLEDVLSSSDPLFRFDISQLQLENITFDPLIIDQFTASPLLRDWIANTAFSLEGNFSSLMADPHYAFHLLINSQNFSSTYPDIHIKLDTKEELVTVSLGIQSVPSSFLFPQFPHFDSDLVLRASGSIHAWESLWQEGDALISPIRGGFEAIIKTDSQQSQMWIDNDSFLAGRYLICSKQEIDLFDLIVKSPFAYLKGNAVLTKNQEIKKGSFSGDIHHFKWLALLTEQPIEGQASFQGSVHGSLSQPYCWIEAKIPHLTFKDRTLKQLNSVISSEFSSNCLKGTLAIKIDDPHYPHTMKTSFSWEFNQSLSLSQIELEGIGTHLNGELSVLFPDLLWTGQLTASIDDLHVPASLFDIPLKGEGSLHVDLKPAQGIQGHWTASHVHYQTFQAESLQGIFHFSPPIPHTINDLQGWSSLLRIEGQGIQWDQWMSQTIYADIEAQDLWHLKNGNIGIQFKQFQTPFLHGDSWTVRTRIDDSSSWPFMIQGEKEKWDFIANGNWHWNGDKGYIAVDTYKGMLESQAMSLLNPVTLKKEGSSLHLSPLALELGETKLAAQFDFEAETFTCFCQGHKMPANWMAFLNSDIPLTGKLTFSSQFGGRYEDPQGHLNVTLHKVQIQENIFATKPFIEGELHIQTTPQGLTIQGELQGVGKETILADGILPLSLRAYPLSLAIDPQKSFHLNLQAHGELDPYLHLFYNDISNLTGKTKLALHFHGPLQSPLIEGQIDLYDGTYESLSTGAIYKNIQAHLTGTGSKLILENFSAQDSQNGKLTAHGEMRLEASQDFPFSFDIQTEQTAIVNSDYMTIIAHGPLNFHGTKKQSKLQGHLVADQAIVRLEEALPNQVKTVDFKYINEMEEEGVITPIKKDSIWPLNLDIKLDLSDQVMIKGHQFNSEWKGAVAITGTTDHPLVHGDLRSLHGEYQFNGKPFSLTQGHIHFSGAPDKKTTLYAVASREIDRIRAEIIVKGPANKLTLSFRSEPPLSEREVLSYILFNHGIADITSDQGARLKQSFVELNASQDQGSDFLTRLRNNVGIIDRLDLNGEGEEDLSLQIGKYITDGVFISINKSLSEAANRVAIEANLMKNFKAQAEVSDDEQGKVMLKWKRDY